MHTPYEPPALERLGSLHELTTQKIFKQPVGSDNVFVSGQPVGSTIGSE